MFAFKSEMDFVYERVLHCCQPTCGDKHRGLLPGLNHSTDVGGLLRSSGLHPASDRQGETGR